MTRCVVLVSMLLVFLHRGLAALAPSSSEPEFPLQGRVLDAMCAPIAGARVTATATGRPARFAITDQAGTFTLALPAGRYTVRVSADGFIDASMDMIAGAPGRQSRDFVLQVAGIHEAVTVAALGGNTLPVIISATKTPTPLRDVPQSVTVVGSQLIQDQLMASIGDVVR